MHLSMLLSLWLAVGCGANLTSLAQPRKTPILCPVDSKWAEFCFCYEGDDLGGQQAFMVCKSCGWKNSWLSQSPTFHSQPSGYRWTVKFDDVCFSYVPPEAFVPLLAEEIIFHNILIQNFTLAPGAFDGSQVERLYFGSDQHVEIAGLLPISSKLKQLTVSHINLGRITTGGFDGLSDCLIRLQGCTAREIQPHSFSNLVNCSLLVEEGPLGAHVDPHAFFNSKFHQFSYPSLERSLCLESWFRNVSVYQFHLNAYRGKGWPYCIDELTLTAGPNGETSEFHMEYSQLEYLRRANPITVRPNNLFQLMTVTTPVDISFRHSADLSEMDGDTFAGVPEITRLDLSGTAIRFLPDFPRLSNLSLTSILVPDQMACDCRSLWMYRWLFSDDSRLLPEFRFCVEPEIDFITLLHHLCTLPAECPGQPELSGLKLPATCVHFIPNDLEWGQQPEETQLDPVTTPDENIEEVEVPDKPEKLDVTSAGNAVRFCTGGRILARLLAFLSGLAVFWPGNYQK